MKTKENELIHKVMDNFDFKRVHKAMIAIEWNWQFGDGNIGIPHIDTIKKIARF